MPTTDRDAQALTYLAKRLRDETHGAGHWDEAGIHAVIAKLVGRNLATTIEQVARHAADPEARTPGAINRAFLPASPTPDATNRPPMRGEDCPLHAGQWAESCRGCAADRLAGTNTLPADLRRRDRESIIAKTRAEIAAARTRLCPCGVDPAKCDAHDPRKATTQPEGARNE